MTAGDDLLVVLPCLNERAHLPGVLASLRSDPATRGALFVVADGGSTDGAREWTQTEGTRDPRVILLDNPARRQAAGVNLAVSRFGRGRRWLLRVDAHADYPPDYAGRLLAAAVAARGATSVVVAMRTVGTGCFQRAAAAAQNSRLGAGGAAHRREGAGGWIDHGHHALFALDAFVASGGYDESFAANEDAELDGRLVRAGGRIWLAGEVLVDYYPRRTPAGLFRQYLRNGGGRVQTLIRHGGAPKLRQVLPSLVAPAVALVALAPWAPVVALPAAAWTVGSLAYGAVLAVKARRPCVLLAGPAAMIMHLAWSLGFWRSALFGRRTAPPAGALPLSRG